MKSILNKIATAVRHHTSASRYAASLMTLYLLNMASAWAGDGCTISLSGRNATLSNGVVTAKVGSNGRVSSLNWRSYSLLSSNGIYFDYTAASNTSPSFSKAEIIKQSDDYVEVLYTDNTSDLNISQGYIMRKGVNGLYTYIIVKGTSKSSDVNLREARVCTRLAENFSYGYVDNTMRGTLPTVATMQKVDTSGKIQDATFRLPDGSIYTKYNWANWIVNDSVHGLIDPTRKIGVWNIPCSHEWLNGGPTRQELTVHTDTKSPLTIQMIQGEHFGASSQHYDKGEEKIYGPFLIYVNRKNTIDYMVADAKAVASTQQSEWPFNWFSNSLYPTPDERATVTGKLHLTNYSSSDSLMVVLAQPGGDLMTQGKGYIYWAQTADDGTFTLKGVRKGSYALYAYALRGDITEQLEKDDVSISEHATDLGTIEWTPVRYTDELVLIGENNRRSDGFRVSDSARAYGLWQLVPATLTFTMGQSNPKSDWYYAQCQNGTWTIVFNSDKTYTGQAHLTFSLAGVTNSAKLQCALNGTKIGSPFGFSNDAAIYRSATQGGHHRLKVIDFNASLIKKGSNRLTLTMSGIGSNGGMMYDCIKLEAGDAVTSAITSPIVKRNEAVDTYWYNLAGQRVTKPQRGIYIHNGKKVVVNL